MGLETGAIIAIASAVTSAAAGGYSAYASSQAQKQQAKQASYNAEAQQDAMMVERQRKAAELAENQRRLANQEKRERAALASSLADSGLVSSTGTPLALMGDTMEAQDERRADMLNEGRLDMWGLDAQGQAVLQEGKSQSRLLRNQAGATLLSGLASSAVGGVQTYNSLKPAKTP